MAEFTTTLHDTIAAYALIGGTGTYFATVFKGEPNSLTVTGGKAQARWQVIGTVPPPEGERTLVGQRMVEAIFEVACYWPVQALEGKQQAVEDEIAEVMLGLPSDIVGLNPTTDTIGGKTVNLVTVPSTARIQRNFLHQSSDQEYRVLTFEVRARIPEASA